MENLLETISSISTILWVVLGLTFFSFIGIILLIRKGLNDEPKQGTIIYYHDKNIGHIGMTFKPKKKPKRTRKKLFKH